MVNFANPQLLYLLLPVALLGLLYWWMRYLRKRKLMRFGNISLLRELMPDVSKYLPNVKIVLSLLALCALTVVLARPRTQGTTTDEEMQGIEVMIAVDVSNSMLASSTDDPRGVSRLQRAKHVLTSLLSKLNNDRVGLIVFAGDAFTQLPLTPDFMSAKLYINELSPALVDNQGTSIGAAIEVAMNSFSGAPDVERAIVVITDAEDQIGDAELMAATAKREGIEVDVIGLGSGKGAQIPLDRSYTNWLKDENGQVVTTFLNEKLAQDIAAAGGGVYINGASSSALNELAQRLDEIKKANLGKVTYTASDEQFPVFAWIALILIILDCTFSNRKIGFLRKYNFFSKGSTMVALFLTCTLAATAQAPMPTSKPLEDTSTRKERNLIREGNEDFNKGHYNDADLKYRRALQSNPGSEVARFNQALTMLHIASDNPEGEQAQKMMSEAVETLNELMAGAENPAVAEWAAYNLGNVAFGQQNLKGALNAYKQSLRKNPSNELARENLRYVQKQMENQQNQDQNQDQQDQQQQQQQQQQEQQEQEQNQDQQQQQNQQQNQEQQQQQEQNISSNSREQILNAVERKDAAARARAAQQNAKDNQNSQRQRGKNW